MKTSISDTEGSKNRRKGATLLILSTIIFALSLLLSTGFLVSYRYQSAGRKQVEDMKSTILENDKKEEGEPDHENHS